MLRLPTPFTFTLTVLQSKHLRLLSFTQYFRVIEVHKEGKRDTLPFISYMKRITWKAVTNIANNWRTLLRVTYFKIHKRQAIRASYNRNTSFNVRNPIDHRIYIAYSKIVWVYSSKLILIHQYLHWFFILISKRGPCSIPFHLVIDENQTFILFLIYLLWVDFICSCHWIFKLKFA